MDCCCITGLENVPESVRGCVLTIGNFDGVHLGHQRILKICRVHADAARVPVVAITLHPHPAAVLHPQRQTQYLAPMSQRCQLLNKAGADIVVIARTDDSLLDMSPEEFIKCIIIKRFAPIHIVEGSNFYFGLARSGTVKTLVQAGQFEGFSVDVINPVKINLPDGPQQVSSTLIRSLIKSGRMADATKCLGYPYCLYGKVVAGQGRGRQLEFPTANIESPHQVIPADGVYAGSAIVDGKTTPAAISVGTKPTLGPTARTVEAFLVSLECGDPSRVDLYGKNMELTFTDRLRDQVKFAGPDDLRSQIEKDVESVQRIYSERI